MHYVIWRETIFDGGEIIPDLEFPTFEAGIAYVADKVGKLPDTQVCSWHFSDDGHDAVYIDVQGVEIIRFEVWETCDPLAPFPLTQGG